MRATITPTTQVNPVIQIIPAPVVPINQQQSWSWIGNTLSGVFNAVIQPVIQPIVSYFNWFSATPPSDDETGQQAPA